jgi:hypothetical protein
MFPAAVAACFLALTLALGDASLPSGYRYPTAADRDLDWKEYKAEWPEPFHAQADFNGDGLKDHVWLLLRTSGKGWGLFAFLQRKNGPPDRIKLDEDSGQTPAQRLGIAVVQPGRYPTACGKGYGECSRSEPASLLLTLPAIDFFTFESANSYFWWNAKSRRFERTWMSD